MELCCKEYRYVVDVLKKTKVYSFSKVVDTFVLKDGTLHREVSKRDNGFWLKKNIYVQSGLDDKVAAGVSVHEVQHDLQPPDLKFPETEVEAYKKETEYRVSVGLPVRPGWVNKDGSVNEDAIRSWLLDQPEFNPVDGREFLKQDVVDKTLTYGWDCSSVEKGSKE